MLGLIKKDFLLIKANLKSMVIIFIVYCSDNISGSLSREYLSA